MVRHGTAKKRRRGIKFSRKSLPKNKQIKIRNAIVHEGVRQLYDSKMTPAENLASFGLTADVNKMSRSSKEINPDCKISCPAFMGFAETLEEGKDVYYDKNSKRKVLTDFQMQYVKKNIDAHGKNYEAMFRDIKVNDKQYTAQKLETLSLKYHRILAETTNGQKNIEI